MKICDIYHIFIDYIFVKFIPVSTTILIITCDTSGYKYLFVSIGIHFGVIYF